jgi:hypothetical protein
MIDLDRSYGPWSGRVWGLIANFASNATALYGIAGYLRDGTHLVPLVGGLLASALCVLLLARPGR